MITLTNGVQVPENAVQLRTTAAIDGYYVTQPLRLVQYDETLPVAAVQLTYQNQLYTPPTGAELNVRMGKPDGTTVYNPCLGMDSSGIVYFAFTQQMTIVAGTGTLTVEITDSGVKNSAPIIAEIRPNPVPEGSIESADEFLTLQEILAEAEKWGQIVQTNAANIQQVVDNLEDIQNAAENAQAAAESAAAAQKAAQEALGFRTFFSAVRPDSNGNLDPSRPMTVGPAASVEIESAGDRIQSVTALGFTQQAGTGDPSPSNVRQLTNGGLKLVKLALDGTEEWEYRSDLGFFVSAANKAQGKATNGAVYRSQFQGVSVAQPSNDNSIAINAYGQLVLKASGYNGNVTALTTDLSSQNSAGDPVIVWYVPADESDATGLYAPIILTSGEYRATCLELTAPLCEGDSVVSWAKSGCDVKYELTGNESYTKYSNGIAFSRVFSGTLNNPKAYCTDFYQISTGNKQQGAFWFGYGDTNVYCFINPEGTAATDEQVQAFKAEAQARYAAGNPITFWYRSTNYTPAADIPVSMETHVRAVRVFDGTEAWKQQSANGQIRVGMNPTPKPYSSFYCTEFKYVSDTGAGGAYFESSLNVNPTGGQFGDLIGTGLSTTEVIQKWKEHLAAQYAAGTPVTIVYQLATPITYAHPAVVLEAATGDQLTYTVTGQSGGTVSVALKPFQDGGHAATADNAQQLDGLTLAALQNLLVPVGYIFSWAPVDDGPDLSTPAKVAAYFGFGTWAAYGTGQVLVGVDSGQTEFATVGQTGGEKMHTLTTQELPSVSPGVKYNNRKPIALDSGDTDGYKLSFTSENVAPNNIVAPFGGGQAHNNLQPYITVYRWQRVA